MKSGLQEKAYSPGSPAEPAALAAPLTAPAERLHRGSPISPATADDDFAKNLAAKFAARFERLRDGTLSTPPSPTRRDSAAHDIDTDDATDRLSSLFAPIRTGRVGIGFLLLTLGVAVTVVVLWIVPFGSSEPLPSSHIDQAKAVGLPADDLTEQAPSAAPAPAVSLPPSSPSPVKSSELPPAARGPLVAQPTSPALKPEEIREIQGRLKVLGFDPGPVDGVVGPMTTGAARKYSEARAIANAELTSELLIRLRSESPTEK